MAVITGQQPNLREAKGWRRTKNRIATVLMVIAFVLAVIPLVFVLITVVARGIGIISWQFLTADIPPQVGGPFLACHGHQAPRIRRVERLTTPRAMTLTMIVNANRSTPSPISAARNTPVASPNWFAMTAGML